MNISTFISANGEITIKPFYNSHCKVFGFIMKILIAGGAHKTFASPREISQRIAGAMIQAYPMGLFDVIPVADGGDGTIQAFTHNNKDTNCFFNSKNPLDQLISFEVGILDKGNTAVIETADIIGLKSIDRGDRYNTLFLSSFELGVAIKNIIEHLKIKKLLIGLGGSIISDGGIGAAYALGFRFFDKSGNEVLPILGTNYCALDLLNVQYIHTTNLVDKLAQVDFCVLSDVDIKLTGNYGQAINFAKQKGATDADALYLENALIHWQHILQDFCKKDVNIPYSGASGGVASAFFALLNAKLLSGTDFILSKVRFDDCYSAYDWVITSEGKLDKTTAMNKVCFGIAQRCEKINKPYIGIFGRVDSVIPEFSNRFIDASLSDSNFLNREYFSFSAIEKAAVKAINLIQNS